MLQNEHFDCLWKSCNHVCILRSSPFHGVAFAYKNVGNTCIALRPKKQRTWHEWCYSLKTASFRIGVSMPRLCRVSVRVFATIRNIHRCTYSPTSVRPVTRHESSALSSCKPHSIFALCFLAYRSFLLPTDRIIATRSSSSFIFNLSIFLPNTDLFECPQRSL